MIDKKDDDFLADNVKGLMMDAVARWNRRIDRAQRQSEFASVRPADQRVFAHMRGRPTKLSDFHVALSISRQAAYQSIARLVDQGLVRLEPAPGSERDKLVCVTEKGQRLRTFAAQQIREIEALCAAALGEEGLKELRRLLKRLNA